MQIQDKSKKMWCHFLEGPSKFDSDLDSFIIFFNMDRVRFLMGLTNLLDAAYIAGLNDDKIVQLFLHGDPLLSFETNVNIISLAQSFIVDSKRFDLRILQ